MHLLLLALILATAPPHAATAAAPIATPRAEVPGPHVIYGIVREVGPSTIVLLRHDGALTVIDVSYAKAIGRTGVLYVKRPVAVYGAFEAGGRYRANAIETTYGIEHGYWPADH